MGLLDSVVGMLGGGATGQSGGQAQLLQAVFAMLGNDRQAGGLSGLVAKFQQGGMGDVVNSWVGTGQNMPISAQQLQQVLGSDMLSGLAARFGHSQDELGGLLSQLLPQVVDHLTPNGQLPAPANDGLGDLGAILGRFQ